MEPLYSTYKEGRAAKKNILYFQKRMRRLAEKS
jgi:hypothetical protein